MPFSSKAQQGYLHSHPEILGSKIHEWDKATAGRHLPEHVKVYDKGGKVTKAYQSPKPDSAGLHPQYGGAVEEGHDTRPLPMITPRESFTPTPKAGFKLYDKGGLVTPQKDNPMAGMFDQITKGGDKPKKEIHKMEITKSHNGKHIVTHKHHHPEHHPDETHVMNDMSALHSHLEDHAGTPNDGEAAPAAPSAGGPAQMTAAPSPMAAGPAPAGM